MLDDEANTSENNFLGRGEELEKEGMQRTLTIAS